MGKQRHQIPQKRLPPETKLLRLSAAYDELRGRYEHMRRLLWMAVHVAKGRLEIQPDVYEATMKAPTTDTAVKVETDERSNRVVLVFCDEKGERLPESEPKLVVATDA